MAYEDIFNTDLAKKLIYVEDPQSFLDDEFGRIKERMVRLNQSRQEMADGFKKVLVGLNQAFPDLDLHDPNLDGTPDRMARALIEVCSGLGVTDKEVFSKSFPSGNYNEMVMLKDIEYTSLCSHHFFPFTGHAHIGYLPSGRNDDSRVVGVSKLARIVDVYAKRPQLQERLCMQIMNAIKEEIKPDGVMVVVEGKHGCVGCRGVKKLQAKMVTSALDGMFKSSHKLRSEFLSLLDVKDKE